MQILKKELKLLGVSVAEFAEQLNVSETAVYLWITGRFLPKTVHIKKMRQLGISDTACLEPSKDVEV